MKEYLTPMVEKFSYETLDVITASGDQIVSSYHQSQASQTMESDWKDSWQ